MNDVRIRMICILCCLCAYFMVGSVLGGEDMDRRIEVNLSGHLYQIPASNLGENDGLLSRIESSIRERGSTDELLVEFDSQVLESQFDIDVGSYKTFVVRVGKAAETRARRQMNRAHRVMRREREFESSVIEEGPSEGLYRVFESDDSRHLWEIASQNPMAYSGGEVDQNTVFASCSADPGLGNHCSFSYISDGYVVTHRMAEEFATLNNDISQFVVDRMEEWRVRDE